MDSWTILLVEDNPRDEMLTLRALKKWHVANLVTVVRDGAEALDYLFATGEYAGRDLSDLPTVVLLDLKLPKIDGLEILRCLWADARYKLLPVVILTPSSEERDIMAGYELLSGVLQGSSCRWDLLVDADNYLLELVRSIHINQVRASVVELPEKYPWSGHRVYLGGRVVQFHSGTCEGWILGDDCFVDEILSKVHERDHRPPAIPAVIEAVCRLYGLTLDAMRCNG